jgi:hypothetical protein
MSYVNITLGRRRFLGTAAMILATTQLSMTACGDAQASMAKPADQPTMKPGTNTSFGPLKQINAGILNVGYAEAGPTNGQAVMLLHGWPYDIHSYVNVAPRLSKAGYRVIVPYLRGSGTTRFLSSDTFRNGQQSVVALDSIALMDALRIEKAILAGFDWGARSADNEIGLTRLKGREQHASLQKKRMCETKDAEIPSTFMRSISTASRASV